MSNLRYRQIHLDFHTSPHIKDVAAEFDPEEFASILVEARVDSVTCFSKCHHGMIYHDTRFPARHPHLKRNLLAEQIQACHKRGIRVPVYISVGFDDYMATQHPEWLQIDCNGQRHGAGPTTGGWRFMCLNSAYTDYLVEEAHEVLDIFGSDVDGFFFDIYVQMECCCRDCVAAMLKAGYDPESSEERKRYSRGLIDGLKHRLTDAVKSRSAQCSVFHNNGHIGPFIRPVLPAYTHLEIESLPSGGWGYEHFPISVRYARNLGMDFVGMTGRFHKSWADFGGYKNQAALDFECFSALAAGGGCSVGDQLHPSGRISRATYSLIGSTYRKVEQKQPWVCGARAMTEIGVITPEAVPGRARGVSEEAAGAYRTLKEAHYQFDFIDFDMDLSRYKVLVLPDVITLTPEQARTVNEYVRGGGKLLLSGRSGMTRGSFEFAVDHAPARVLGEAHYSPDYVVVGESIAQGIPDAEHVMYERGLRIEPAQGTRELVQVWKPYFERSYKHFCSHFHTPAEGPAGYPGAVADDSIVYIGYPIFGMYKRHGSRVYRQIVTNSLRLLLPDSERLVRTSAPTTADITLNYQPEHDRYVMHILHYVPERRASSVSTVEDVIPLYDVETGLLLPDGYDDARLVPQNTPLAHAREDGRLELVVPSVSGHQMVSIGRANQ